MEKRTRTILLWLICAACLLASGCAKVAQSVTVNEDGSFDTVQTVVGQEGVKNDITKMFTEMQANDMRPIHDAETGWNGYEAGFHDENLAAFLQRTPSFQKIDKKKYDVKMETGWLYDAYVFHAYFPEGKESMPASRDYNPNDPNRFRYGFTLNLPYASEKNNADTISEDGKVLYWDLASAVSRQGGDANIHAEFRLWHWQHIGITALVAAVLAFLGFRGWRRSKMNTTDSVNQKNIALLCGGALLIGLGWCGYSVTHFPVLTETNAVGTDASASKSGLSGLLPSISSEVDTSDVKTETRAIPQGKLNYPAVILENQKAASDINQDIKSLIDKYVEAIANANPASAEVTYNVRGNADDYISIVLNQKRVDKKGHESFFYRGIVYNKKTGRRMSLDDFLRLNREDVLQEAKDALYAYPKLEEGTKHFRREEAGWAESSDPKLPDSFFLDNQGNLFLLFGAGRLAKGEIGVTCVKFTPYSILKHRRAIGILAK